jgi:sulfite reductase (NADPH) flavoprotein alpha-component
MALLPPALRTRFAALHRWTALVLSPLFIALLLSGAVLAFDPILNPPKDAPPRAQSASATPPAARLSALLAKVDPENKATFAALGDDNQTARVGFGRGKRAVYDLDTAKPVEQKGPGGGGSSSDVFGIAKRIHERLFFGGLLEALVTLASIAMGLLVLAGPLLSGFGSKPKTPRGWHVFVGWALWPLLALPLVSLVMMKLQPSAVDAADREKPPLPLAQALGKAGAAMDLSRLRVVQAIPGGAVVIVESASGEDQRYVVNGAGIRELNTKVARLGHGLHEGTWAGRLGGVVSLVSALGLLTMLGTGIVSWLRMRKKAAA